MKNRRPYQVANKKKFQAGVSKPKVVKKNIFVSLFPFKVIQHLWFQVSIDQIWSLFCRDDHYINTLIHIFNSTARQVKVINEILHLTLMSALMIQFHCEVSLCHERDKTHFPCCRITTGAMTPIGNMIAEEEIH